MTHLAPNAPVVLVFNRGTLEQFTQDATVVEQVPGIPTHWFVRVGTAGSFGIHADAIDARAA